MYTILEHGYNKHGREIELRYNYGSGKLYIWQDNGSGRTTETHGANDDISKLWTALTTVASTNGAS